MVIDESKAGVKSLSVLKAEFRAGETVVVEGKIGERTVRRTKSGELFVKAPLQTEDGAALLCVWWNSRNAPSRVTGSVFGEK